jgi:hypothetical protein
MYDNDVKYDEKGMLTSEKKYNAAVLVQENTYNGRKKPLKEIQYTNGIPGLVTEYMYNNDGNPSSVTKRTGANAQIERVEKVYKGKNLTEVTTYNNQNTLLNKITYDYDREGNITEEFVYGEMQIAKVHTVYEYDGKGHKTGETHYNEGKLDYKTSYNYDGDRLMSIVTADNNAVIAHTRVFAYDAKNNKTKDETFEKGSNRRSEEVMSYDANNNMVSSVITENKQLQGKTLYTYDSNNNLTSVKVIDSKGKLADNRNYTYTYDGHNNWTKKEVSIAGQPAFVVERTITYYE